MIEQDERCHTKLDSCTIKNNLRVETETNLCGQMLYQAENEWIESKMVGREKDDSKQGERIGEELVRKGRRECLDGFHVGTFSVSVNLMSQLFELY